MQVFCKCDEFMAALMEVCIGLIPRFAFISCGEPENEARTRALSTLVLSNQEGRRRRRRGRGRGTKWCNLMRSDTMRRPSWQ